VASKRGNESSSRSSTRKRPSFAEAIDDRSGRLVRIGRVGRPHGTEGGFSVSEPTGRSELLEPGRSVWVGERATTVVWRKGTVRAPLVKLEGVDDREGARSLGGAEILAPREALGPIAPGEHLIDDLVGMEVVDGDRSIGRVLDVVVLPSVEALEVERPGSPSLLVPLVRDAVRSIDTVRSVVDIDYAFLREETEPDRGN
jgi:16S rRNA processing protein RimM